MGKPGEGGFLETCIEHVAAQGNAFDVYQINGTKENAALTKWWLSDGTLALNTIPRARLVERHKRVRRVPVASGRSFFVHDDAGF